MEKPFRGPALTEVVKEHIQHIILDNLLKPGDPLPSESALSQDLGVGRSSIREAVKVLQAAGIVEIHPGHGLYVREYNTDSIMENFSFGMRFNPTIFRELLQIRMLLETALIDQVVLTATREDFAQLRQILVRWEDAIRKTGKHNPEFDHEFHLRLYRNLGNETVLRFLEAFWTAFLRLEDHSFKKIGEPSLEQAYRTLREHQDLLEALEKRDVGQAKQVFGKGFAAYNIG